MFCRLIALFNHAANHGEKRFVEGFSRSCHLLGDFFAIGIGFNEFLQATQLAFNAGQTDAKGFLFFWIGNTAHGVLSEELQIMITFVDFSKQ